MDKHIEDLLAKMMEGILTSDDEAQLEEAIGKDEDLCQLVEELKSHYKLEAYLNNEQTSTEKENLESKLNQDSGLREKMEGIKMLHSFLDVAETHQIQQALDQITQHKKKIKWGVTIGMSAFLFAFLAWIVIPNEPFGTPQAKPPSKPIQKANPSVPLPKKDSTPIEPWPDSKLRAIADAYRTEEVEMGTRGKPLDSLSKLWLPLFRNKQYKELANFIQPLDSTFFRFKNDEGLFALGYAYFHLKNYQSARKVFSKVTQMESSLWTQRARWYLVLSYIYLQDKQNCILTLQTIKNSPDHYNYNEAVQLLKRVNSL